MLEISKIFGNLCDHSDMTNINKHTLKGYKQTHNLKGLCRSKLYYM